MRLVGIGEMIISETPDDVLAAPNLGSCLGIAVYDPVHKRAGMIHCMLPLSKSNQEKAADNPSLYVDTGVVDLLAKMCARGSQKKDLVISCVGGSNISDTNNVFEIGKKNYTIFRKVMWKNGLLIKAEHVGDSISRTISLHVDSGEVWLKTATGTNRLV